MFFQKFKYLTSIKNKHRPFQIKTNLLSFLLYIMQEKKFTLFFFVALVAAAGVWTIHPRDYQSSLIFVKALRRKKKKEKIEIREIDAPDTSIGKWPCCTRAQNDATQRIPSPTWATAMPPEYSSGSQLG
jgi:endonuclease YncB( thermonuclease family)